MKENPKPTDIVCIAFESDPTEAYSWIKQEQQNEINLDGSYKFKFFNQ